MTEDYTIEGTIEARGLTKNDFCSFEVSKLFVKKGLKAMSPFFYNKKGELIHGAKSILNGDFDVIAPTTQVAMRFLRGKGIHLVFLPLDEDWSRWVYYFYSQSGIKVGKDEPVHFFDTFDAAVDDALKYVLENVV